MQTPEPMRRHPNATFVLSTTPLTTVLAWAILQAGWTMPQVVAAAFGTLISGGLLIFRTAIEKAGSTVWDLGLVGCCRRILRGRSGDPPAAE